jgi:2-C-methyl-D-erythritol 4-phosphate cytidylyltransferase
MENMKTVAIITAGGLGLRLPGDVKKQFRLLDGKPLLVRAMEPFLARADISDVIVTLPAAELDYFQGVAADYFAPQATPVLHFCEGGQQRQDSVFAAVKLCPSDTELLIIHDGVRPFVSTRVLDELLTMTREFGAAVPGAPVKHTIKTIKNNIIDHTIRRDILLQVYTPQVFSFNIIVKSYYRAMMEEHYSTDDAALLEHYGYSVHYVNDSSFNLKITDEYDFFLAEQVLKHNLAGQIQGI